MDSLGTRLKDERLRLGLSQAALAAIAGLQVNAQRQYECDERLPKADYLESVAHAGVDIRYILLRERTLGNPGELTDEECLAIKSYRHLDERCQKAVEHLLRSLIRDEQPS